MTDETGQDTKNGQRDRDSVGDAERPPLPNVRPRREQRISWIWLVPILAVIVGSALMARDWLATGPSITISFESAEGIDVGQTQIRYKDVAVGTVSDVTVDHERGLVLVTAELNRDGAEYITQPGSRFWVVRPRLAISGVSGLGTILSGVYIAVDTPSATETEKNPSMSLMVWNSRPRLPVADLARGIRFKVRISDGSTLVLPCISGVSRSGR